MKNAAHTLFVSDRGCWLARCADGEVSVSPLQVTDHTNPVEIAQAPAKLLAELGSAAADVVLALASDRCLCAAVDGSQLRRRTLETLTYALEDKLPVGAEEMVADFIVHPDHTALGVAVTIQAMRELVDALEAEGIEVRHICPLATLAGQAWTTSRCEEEGTALLWQDENRVEFMVLERGKLRVWQNLDCEGAAVSRALRAQLMLREPGAPFLVHAIGLQTTILQTITSIAQLSIQQHEQPMPQHAAGAAEQILRERWAPWIDLRRGSLAASGALRRAKGPLGFAFACLILLLGTCAADLFWRTSQYRGLSAAAYQQQRQAYQVLYPSQNVPSDVLSRLRAEYRKSQALAGKVKLPDEQGQSALTLLCRCLAALPSELRFRIDELRIDEGKLYLEGDARSHGDAEALASALRSGSNMSIESPRSEQRASGGGVAFILVGSPSPAQSKAALAGERH